MVRCKIMHFKGWECIINENFSENSQIYQNQKILVKLLWSRYLAPRRSYLLNPWPTQRTEEGQVEGYCQILFSKAPNSAPDVNSFAQHCRLRSLMTFAALRSSKIFVSGERLFQSLVFRHRRLVKCLSKSCEKSSPDDWRFQSRILVKIGCYFDSFFVTKDNHSRLFIWHIGLFA